MSASGLCSHATGAFGGTSSASTLSDLAASSYTAHFTQRTAKNQPINQIYNMSAEEHASKEEIPIQEDDAPVEDPIDADTADSDKQLGKDLLGTKNDSGTANSFAEKDEKDAIDKSNIVESRTRGAGKQKGALAEPGDEEGIPTDD